MQKQKRRKLYARLTFKIVKYLHDVDSKFLGLNKTLWPDVVKALQWQM